MKIYIPSSFIFEDVFPDQSIHKDKYNYVLHKIYEEKIFGKKNNHSEFVNLNAAILRYIIGRWCYKTVLNNLIQFKIIETDNHYIVKEKSRGYKLLKPFSDSKHRAVELKDRNILQRIAKYRETTLNIIPFGTEYKMLFDNLYKVEIDSKNAIRYVKKHFSNDIKKLNSYLISIKFIQDKNFHWTVDPTSNRVHTDISTLFRNIRKYLRYHGQPLVNVDICNSQPFLFNILIRNFIKEKTPHLDKYDDFSKICKDNFRMDKLVYLGKGIYSYDGHSINDVRMYEMLTSEGLFYEYIMDILSIDEELRQKKDFRSIFKKQVFGRIFFCKNNKYYVREEMKIFRLFFPTVAMIIEYYKRNDYTELPINLQKAESELMINNVCSQISIERPGLFLTTIHDSILTTKDNVDYISDVILSVFEKKFHLKPKLKVE